MITLNDEDIVFIRCTYKNVFDNNYYNFSSYSTVENNQEEHISSLQGYMNPTNFKARSAFSCESILLGKSFAMSDNDTLVFSLLNGDLVADFVSMYDEDDDHYYGKYYVLNKDNSIFDSDIFKVKLEILRPKFFQANTIENTKNIIAEYNEKINGLIERYQREYLYLIGNDRHDIYSDFLESRELFKLKDMSDIKKRLEQIKQELAELKDEKVKLINAYEVVKLKQNNVELSRKLIVDKNGCALENR